MASREDGEARAAVFHAGESAVQERSGLRERIEQVGPAMIRDAMPAQHRDFFAKQPLLFVGSLDATRRPWASVLAAPPGFAHSPDPRTLRVDAKPAAGDPFAANLGVETPVGLLGIELATRRRNRMNGTVTAVDSGGFTVGVDQSFGNCPQYIQARDWQWRSDTAVAAGNDPVHLGPALDDRSLAIVREADTMFVASASPHARAHGGADGVDISHRGGLPGFVRVTEAGGASVLTIPDFRGNFLFNTLGNLVAWPRAGLLFVDFASGDLLQLSGRAEVLWESEAVEAYAGAQRLLVVTVDEGRLRRRALPLAWSAPEYATQLEGTGGWNDAPAA